jgi:phosphoglycerate dehydrogenase-like enzyme
VRSDPIVDNPTPTFPASNACHDLSSRCSASAPTSARRTWSSIAGQSALVVGTGAIGRAIARLLTAAGLEVRGTGRVARSGDPDLVT